MTHKYLYQMGVHSVQGNEVSSILSYIMRYQPWVVIALYELHNNRLEDVVTWFSGLAYMLGLFEDEGVPVDIDEALHGWVPDEAFDLEGSIRGWYKENS